MKVCLNISPQQVERNTGIGQVVLAQWKYLQQAGIELTTDPGDDVDVYASHISKPDKWPRIDLTMVHGLYWDDTPHNAFSGWHHDANRRIIESVRQSIAVTVPAHWVGEPFRRDMRFNPVVMPHGIDIEEFKPGRNEGYILYNKNREGDVCQSRPAWELANKGVKVTSTFSPVDLPVPDSMTLTGNIPFAKMLPLIAGADMYLGTTLETFGIGTIEALACGVPVLGYNWGGTADIVQHGVNGYLVEPGDVAGLFAGMEYIRSNRARLSEAARATAERYTWDKIIKRYIRLFETIVSYPRRNDVAVVIACYNYGQWVGQAIQSVIDQTVKPSELIVVDDGSKDNSREVIGSYRAAAEGAGIRFVPIFQANTGVAGARNNGIAAATADFIVSLDADDKISPTFIQTLRPALAGDRGLGIAYSGLGFLDGDGDFSHASSWPPDFNWEVQSAVTNPPSNCIPSACMFRREMWRRAGGYKQEYAPGEDAEFWTRGLSVGYRARRVTTEPLFLYRGHEGSASRTKKYSSIEKGNPWMISRDYPIGAPAKAQPVVKSNVQPAVSVIIPVGPGHEGYVPGALDTLLGQTFYSWEAVIVNDTGKPLSIPSHYPFARVINNAGKRGAGVARNVGVNAARGPLVFFLDVDDLLAPDALEKMTAAFRVNDGRYVYSDWLTFKDGTETRGEAKDPNRSEWRMYHPVSVLIPTQTMKQYPFDEDLPSWEDWDLFLKLAVNGVCGVRVQEPLLIYRLESGFRRMKVINPDGSTNSEGSKILAVLDARYGGYFTGEKQMSPCKSCGGAQASHEILKAKRAVMGDQPPTENFVQPTPAPTMVRLEFTGTRVGSTTYTVHGHQYRAGNNTMDKFVDVIPNDAPELLETGSFRVVYQPPAPPPAAPVQQAAPVNMPTPAPEPAPMPTPTQAQNALLKARSEFDAMWAEQEAEFDKPLVKVADQIPEQEPVKPTPAPAVAPAKKTGGRRK